MTIKIRPWNSCISKNKLNISDYILFLFLAFGIGNITTSIYRPVLLVLGLLWVVFIFPSFKSANYLKDKSFLCYAMFVLIYALLLWTSTDFSNALAYLGSYIIYMLLFLVAAYYDDPSRKERLVRVSGWIHTWIIVLCVLSILYYAKNPGAARLHMSHRSDLDGYMIGGGYALSYICTLIVPFIVQLFFQGKGSLKLFVYLGIMFYLIYETSSAIILFVGIIASFVSFMVSGTQRKRIVSIIVALLFLGAFLILKNQIGQLLIDISRGRVVTSFSDMNNALYVRMTEIGEILQGENIQRQTAFLLRLENYMLPLESILKSPLWGSIFSRGVEIESGIYCDSKIISAISVWGFPLAFLNIYPVFRMCKKCRRYTGVFVALFLLLLLNPSECFSIYAGIIIVLPCLAYFYDNTMKREIES